MILKTRDGLIEVQWTCAQVGLSADGAHLLSTDEAAALIAALQENLSCARGYAEDRMKLGSRAAPTGSSE